MKKYSNGSNNNVIKTKINNWLLYVFAIFVMMYNCTYISWKAFFISINNYFDKKQDPDLDLIKFMDLDAHQHNPFLLQQFSELNIKMTISKEKLDFPKSASQPRAQTEATFSCVRTWPYRFKLRSFSMIKPVLFRGRLHQKKSPQVYQYLQYTLKFYTVSKIKLHFQRKTFRNV